MKRAVAAAAVTTVGVIGFSGIAGASEPTTPYVVQPGDTLSRIAPDNWREVAAGNGIDNPDMIYVGQVIDLSATAPAPAYQPTRSQRSSSSRSEAPASSSSGSQTSRSQASSSSGASSSSSGGTVWDQLAECESGGNWSTSTGNGYYGGLQFSQGSWNAAGGTGSPADASREEQIRVAQNLQSSQGWGAWPACSRELGLR
jgi:LysM repeat protein